MASVGQAVTQSLHPMQSFGLITAVSKGTCSPQDWSNGRMFNSNKEASLRMPSSPPGGQRFIFSPLTIALAYSRQPLWPHCSHCVCGRMLSIFRTNGSIKKDGYQRFSARRFPGCPLRGDINPLVLRTFRADFSISGLPHKRTRDSRGSNLRSAVASKSPLSIKAGIL